jgi:hypothetical protein
MTGVACAVMLNGGELEVRAQAKAQAEANIQKELQGKKENCAIYFQNYFQNSNTKKVVYIFQVECSAAARQESCHSASAAVQLSVQRWRCGLQPLRLYRLNTVTFIHCPSSRL